MKYCCEWMKHFGEYECQQHDKFECPDNLIYYSKQKRTFGIIIHDGGTSFMTISFCPWCGKELNKKKDKEPRRMIDV